MAFGQRKQDQDVVEKETKVFENFRVDLKTQGTRLIRLLPYVDEAGNFIDGNGNHSEYGETADEVKFAEIWWKFKVDGNDVDRRIITSWAKAYKNPVYRKIEQVYNIQPRSFQEKRNAENDDTPRPRLKFAVNVYDRSPVIFSDSGIASQNENREYVLSNGTKVKGNPEPLNKIRVLEGSDGPKDDGKHMRATIFGLYGSMDRSGGGDLFAQPDPLFLHEFDLKINIVGTGKLVKRNFFPGQNRDPLTKDVLLLPRYNLVEWLKPWPDEMLQRLVDGEDYNEMLKEYKIVTNPRFVGTEAEFE